MAKVVQADPDQEVIYRRPEVERISGKSRSTIYDDMAEGTFPRPIRLGRQSVGWRKSDIDRWIRSRPTTGD